MRILKTALLALSLTLMAAGAQAMMVTATFTVDNAHNAFDGGLCLDSSCTGGIAWENYGALPNIGNWQQADSVTMDLGAGTHWFRWSAVNSGTGGEGNPAGLLAELSWNGMTNSSSSAWDVSLDGSNWTAATEWAQNGGGIWGGVHGGPISGISTNANWLWSDSNFNSSMPARTFFRTSITIAALPEPGTLSLLAFGLAAIAWTRRRMTP